ncbi:hypothetical protein X777_06895 [Ooceraea biroi]|uniref:Uncharacterized protein n=1 Tax=Ooceraea biroi TaxID=2015173 RepID=A0A026WDB5_OOCBI|nr:hypothetical protein X777_06895 [Ooceraea biroi]
MSSAASNFRRRSVGRRDQVLYLGESPGKSDIVSLSYVRDMRSPVKLRPAEKWISNSSRNLSLTDASAADVTGERSWTPNLREGLRAFPQTVNHGVRRVVMCQAS